MVNFDKEFQILTNTFQDFEKRINDLREFFEKRISEKHGAIQLVFKEIEAKLNVDIAELDSKSTKPNHPHSSLEKLEDCLYQMKLYSESILEYFEDWGYEKEVNIKTVQSHVSLTQVSDSDDKPGSNIPASPFATVAKTEMMKPGKQKEHEIYQSSYLSQVYQDDMCSSPVRPTLDSEYLLEHKIKSQKPNLGSKMDFMEKSTQMNDLDYSIPPTSHAIYDMRTPVKSLSLNEIDPMASPTLESLGMSSMTWALLNGGITNNPQECTNSRDHGSLAPSDFSVGTPPSLSLANHSNTNSHFGGLILKVSDAEYGQISSNITKGIGLRTLNEVISEINDRIMDKRFEDQDSDTRLLSEDELIEHVEIEDTRILSTALKILTVLKRLTVLNERKHIGRNVYRIIKSQ